MWGRVALGVCGLYIVAAGLWVVSAGVVRDHGLLNAACDPTRELWLDVNAAFVQHYERERGARVTINQSHGGSGSQARSVIDGMKADVVSLALWTDTDAVRKAGLIDPGWEGRLPNRSLPYTSTIVFVVRKGNPKNVHDWPDIVRGDVQVITPNPKTSGNGKWSFLAAWGSVVWRGGSEAEATAYVTQLYSRDRVPVLDAAARGATMTFAQKGIGDVHLTWENEAYLEVQEANGALEIVYPQLSILAEPHVAIVDANVRKKGTQVAAEAYMRFLYTDEAQDIIARHYHRPTSATAWARHRDRFPELPLHRANTLGAWDDIQKRFFAEGGVFDRIYGGGKR